MSYYKLPDIKVALLAAGEGTRLQPISNYIPKALVPVGGKKPCIRWTIDELLDQKAKQENITVCVNTKQAGLFRYELRDLKLNYMLSDRPFGTAGELTKERVDKFIGDLNGLPLLIIYADDLTQVDYDAMLYEHQHKLADVTLACTDKVPLDYGLVYRHKFTNKVIKFSEKPYMSELKQLCWTGRVLVQPYILEEFHEDEDIAKHVFPRLLKKLGGNMYVYHTSKLWIDCGSISHLRLANKLYGEISTGVSSA